jgi:glycerate dehydrogenase
MTVADTLTRVVFLDRATLPPGVTLRPFAFPHRLFSYDDTEAGVVAARIAEAEVVITNKVPVRAEALASAKNLKLIAIAATGSDRIDLKACAARGICVCNVRNYSVHSVPEHTFALILALRRSLLPYGRSVAEGGWQRSGRFCYFDYPLGDLADSRLGIIGAGVLGQAVASLGRAFGMEVAFAERRGASSVRAGYVPFERLLAESDVISLHVPLTPETRNLIGEREFGLMLRRPLLINTARGGLVDEIALGSALRSGQIAGAGFDVATSEPPGDDHPLLALAGLPNFILTPHVAWASRQAAQVLADQLVENIELFHKGTPRNLVV